MHAWIFRNREQLALLFGLPAPPPPRRVGAVEEPPGLHPRSEAGASGPSATAPYAGRVRRTGRHVILEPFPRRAA